MSTNDDLDYTFHDGLAAGAAMVKADVYNWLRDKYFGPNNVSTPEAQAVLTLARELKEAFKLSDSPEARFDELMTKFKKGPQS